MKKHQLFLIILMLLAAQYKLHISEAKLSLYLLNPLHPDGSSKARFFLGQGFIDVATLQKALDTGSTKVCSK